MKNTCYFLFALLPGWFSAGAQSVIQLGTPFIADQGYSLLFTQDGGFVTSGHRNNRPVLYKTDCAGNLQAEIEKPVTPGRFSEAVELSDGSIVAAGSAVVPTPFDTLERVLLLKTGADLVEKNIAGFLILGKAARAKSLSLAANGDLLVFGEVTGSLSDYTDLFLQRADPNTLQPLGAPVILNNGVDVATEIYRTATNQYLLTGSSYAGNLLDSNAVIQNSLHAISVNESGDVLWQYTYRDSFLLKYGLSVAGGVERNAATGNLTLVGTVWSGNIVAQLDVCFFLLDNATGNLLDTAMRTIPERQRIYGITGFSLTPGAYLAVGDSDNPVLGTPNVLGVYALEQGGKFLGTDLLFDPASPVSVSDVIEIGQNRTALLATLPDNPFDPSIRNIVVVTPQIENIGILYQNCALVASFNAQDPSYQWVRDDVPIPGATSGVYFPTEPGVYRVYITDYIGCYGFSDTLTVDFAAADFTVATDGLTATFSNTSTGAVSYQWDFGDGLTSNLKDPEHTYPAAGPYTVTLIAGDACSADTTVQTIGLAGAEEPSGLDNFRLFPNPNTGVFTLELKGEPQPELSFALFRSTGQLIGRQAAGFQTGYLMQPFTFDPLPPGVYILQIQARGEAKYVKMTVY